ncbi:MAG: hypothetical protein IPP69_16785 [Flavobacteriales bacterium]|nr:hypothetical protein [Flavobacteriales bacterium]
MSTYILTWNPQINPWVNPINDVINIRNGILVPTRWSTGNTKRICEGDIAYFLRQSSKLNGLFGKAVATRGSFQSEHWDENKAGQNANYAEFNIIDLIDPNSNLILSTKFLQTNIPEVNWKPMASGSTIPLEFEKRVNEIWNQFRQTEMDGKNA